MSVPAHRARLFGLLQSFKAHASDNWTLQRLLTGAAAQSVTEHSDSLTSTESSSVGQSEVSPPSSSSKTTGENGEKADASPETSRRKPLSASPIATPLYVDVKSWIKPPKPSTRKIQSVPYIDPDDVHEYVLSLAPRCTWRQLKKACPRILQGTNVKALKIGMKWMPYYHSRYKTRPLWDWQLGRAYAFGQRLIEMVRVIRQTHGWRQSDVEEALKVCAEMLPEFGKEAAFEDNKMFTAMLVNHKAFFNRLAKCRLCKNWKMYDDMVLHFWFVLDSGNAEFNEFLDKFDSLKEMVTCQLFKDYDTVPKDNFVKILFEAWWHVRKRGKSYEEFFQYLVRIIDDDVKNVELALISSPSGVLLTEYLEEVEKEKNWEAEKLNRNQEGS